MNTTRKSAQSSLSDFETALTLFSNAAAVLACATDSVEAKTKADTQASALRAGLAMLYHAYDELDGAILRLPRPERVSTK